MKSSLSKILLIPIVLNLQVAISQTKAIYEKVEPIELCIESQGVIGPSVKSIAESFTIDRCVQDYPFDISESEKAKLDSDVCKCTRGNPLMFNIENLRGFLTNPVLDIYESQEKETSFEIIKARTSAALDASILFDGDEKIIGDLMTNDKYIQATMSDYLREKEKEKIKALKERESSNSRLANKDYRTIVKGIQDKFFSTENKDNPENVHSLKSFFEQGQISQGQCITYREYHGFKQLPTNDEFMDDIITEDFDEKKWKYSALIERYNELESQGINNSGEFLRLKSKIIFLNRNPMMRHLMNSDYGKKKEIFQALREFSENKCNEGTQYLGKLDPHIEKYKAKMKDLLGNSDAQKIIKRSIDQEIKNTLNNSLATKGAPTRGHKSRLDVVSYLEEVYKTSPASCRGKDKDGCLTAYKHYCEEIKSIPDEGINNNGESLNSILRGDFIPDYDRNADLKRVNDLFCNTRLKKDPKNPTERGYTFNEYRAEFCRSQDMIECRSLFLKQYGKSLEDSEAIKLGNFLDSVSVKNVESNKIENIVSGKGSTFTSRKGFDWDSYRRDHGISGGAMAGDIASPKISSTNGGTGGTLASGMLNTPQQQQPSGNFYSAVSAASQNSPQDDSSIKERSISELSPQEQYSLLSDWKRELNEARNNRSDGEHLSDSDKALKDRIAALEALLLQQKSLSDRQYALLNDGLKSKDKQLNEQIAKVEKTQKEKADGTTFGGVIPANEQNFNRAPASVRGNTASGFQGGNTAGEAGRVGSHSQEAQAIRDNSARESLAREEAKLVNLRQETNGGIVLEGAKQGSVPNAIAVSISEEAYKQARSSLVGINLNQIEKNIPKDQIELLEKNGIITLILQNGQNPPLELKVKRLNGSLVQVENTEAVVRRFSLQSLQNTFRN